VAERRRFGLAARRDAETAGRLATITLLLVLPFAAAACARGRQVSAERARESGGDHWAQARAEMVRSQIRARGIDDRRVLDAMERVERHRFVPDDMRDAAYGDHPLPIGHQQTISQPYIVALMSALLELDGHEKVLEIGTGSGYQAAVLGELAREVYTIEIVEPLAARASDLLTELDYDNVHVRAGDGYRGWPEQAPFDAIILTAAPPEIPQPLIDQLAAGGILAAPIGDVEQELRVYERTADGLEQRAVIPVRFVPMTGEAQERRP
jgi:protein-L-isoaspartate(D-aspartate) O-methyltransferase